MELDMTNVDEIVKAHLKASASLEREYKGKPKKIRKFLIEAGILNKKGTGLAKHYR